MKGKKVLIWFIRFVTLLILFYGCLIIGSLAIEGMLPDIKAEPGLVPSNLGVLIMGITNTLLVIVLILSSRWDGWKLTLGLAFAYYGVVTFLSQIETWYFLSDITVGPKLLPRLFIMGLPTAFLFIPLAILILGRGIIKNKSGQSPVIVISNRQWVWKLIIIAGSYLALYWCAGYFIAWQNPELRAFYGSPGEVQPFWTHTVNTLKTDPALFPFQILRSMLWTLCALFVIHGSKVNVWLTAILVGLFFSLPQNVGHIMENPLMPIASVRISHLIETASSTFIFGMIITWLLHREHNSIQDLFGFEPKNNNII